MIRRALSIGGTILCLASMVTLAPAQKRTAGQDWWQAAPVVSSKYYVVKSDLPPLETEALARHMDFTFDSYLSLFSKLPIRVRRPSRLNLYLFSTQKDYLRTLLLRFRIDGAGSWGLHIPRGKETYLVGWKGNYEIEEMKGLLQHEGFHQIASHFFTDLPTWANEGTAGIFERGVLVGNQLALGEISRREKRRLTDAIESGRIIPFEKFFTVGQNEWNHSVRTRGADINYLQAWSIAHFFVFAEEGKYEKGYLTFLVQLNRGIDWKTAFVASFGTPNFKAIEQRWLEHIKNARVSDYRETARRLDFLAAGLKELNERGVAPTSLEQLRDALRGAQFEHLSELYDDEKTLAASSDEPFIVPHSQAEGGENDGRQFVLFDPRAASANRRSSTKSPPPANVYVEGDYPEAFAVTWKRKKREYEYTIESGPNALRSIRKFQKKAKSIESRSRR